MRFDTIIIGGGEGAMTAAITLAEKGRKVAVVTHGEPFQFCMAGALGLLGYTADGKAVAEPLKQLPLLTAEHPYSKVGADAVAELAGEVKEMYLRAGIELQGDARRNRCRISPLGKAVTTWLTLPETPVVADDLGRVLLLAIRQFLDFYPEFIALGMKELGIETVVDEFAVSDSPLITPKSTEKMRATHIAHVLHTFADMDRLAEKINALAEKHNAATVIIPAVVGLNDRSLTEYLASKVTARLLMMPTIPVSVPGVCMRRMLDKRFKQLGGLILNGDTVASHRFENGRLVGIHTTNLEDTELVADTFVLATGSFMSHGLEVTHTGVREAVFNLDTHAPDDADFTAADFFASQPYMTSGVTTDTDLHPMLSGTPVDNLYACGTVLGGCDYITEESAAGIEHITGMAVARSILSTHLK